MPESRHLRLPAACSKTLIITLATLDIDRGQACGHVRRECGVGHSVLDLLRPAL